MPIRFATSHYWSGAAAAMVRTHSHCLTVAAVAALHAVAAALMLATETGFLPGGVFLLVWVFLNAILIGLTRRPSVAAALSLAVVMGLILVSRFKHQKLWLTADFVDLLIVDRDTVAFLLQIFPELRIQLAVAIVLLSGVVALMWRLDPFRVKRRSALGTGVAALAAIALLSVGSPTGLHEDFLGQNYVSKFARSGVEAGVELFQHGYIDAAAPLPEPHLRLEKQHDCRPSSRLPHIILLHDESSFDLSAAPGVRVPKDYAEFFKSFDGEARKLVVEGAGGPSWLTEYNVLTGLSARSFGVFATSATRMAAGRILRGLPLSLTGCGYRTFSLYPFHGHFLGSRAFQETAGISRYLDMDALGTLNFEPDSFYFNRAMDIVAAEHSGGPLFLYVYTVANHFPWDTALRPELTPEWRPLGNTAEIDEYIRRQRMTARQYHELLQSLKSRFPSESFLIVRYGDHQPEFGRRIIAPDLSEEDVARRLTAFDARYFTTYYAIDAVNFAPVSLSSALAVLDAPFLPLVVQEAAGVPLDPAFAAQKEILHRCRGVFFACAGGAEAKAFSRLLIEAGLIRGF